MSLRVSKPPPAPPAAEPDLESTAELPILDPARAGAAEAANAATDTWIIPPATRAALGSTAGAAGLSVPLVGAPGVSVPTVGVSVPTVGAPTAAPPTSATGELRQLEASLRDAHAARAAAEERAAVLSAQLVKRQADAAEYARQLEDSHRALAEAAQRAEAAEEELAQARELVSAMSDRAAHLQQELERLGSEKPAGHDHGFEQRQVPAAERRAQGARLSEALERERARAASYFERLQSDEGRWRMAEAAVLELQQAVDAGESERERLRRELAGRDERLGHLQTAGGQQRAEITRLEQQQSSLGTQLAQREAQLRDSRRAAEGLQASVARLQQEVAADVERIRTLEKEAERQCAADAQRETQLRDSRREVEGLQASVARLQQEVATGAEQVRALETQAEQYRASDAQRQSERAELAAAREAASAELAAARAELASANDSARTAAAAAAAQAAAQDSALAQERARSAQLESELAAQRNSAAQLEEELTTVRGEMEEWGGALKTSQEARIAQQAGLDAAEARRRELEKDTVEQRIAVKALQAHCEAMDARVRELEADLRAAEDTVHRLESDARHRSAHIDELEKSNERWRAAAEEARHASTDSGASPALRDAARRVVDGDGDGDGGGAALPEPAPDGAARLLIHSSGDGDGEVVHVLGRKTSIGRTPDNDLHIDAKYISRHHAVILVGPVNTVIEDLNSTNGVLVNGRRITRQTLADGDQVTIGREVYRFAVRRSGDKR
jgi:chromosome segregation ATPase